jgi:hypothetical protein
MIYLTHAMEYIKDFFTNKLGKMSADTLGWLANIALHCATIPSFFALMTGLTDKPPSVDLVLMIWATLGLLFFKSVLTKDLLNIVTIGVGFLLQATAMALIFFK